MDSFSFLKYLRGGVLTGAHRAPAAATTIAASACEYGDDASSFFDLEFAVPGDESAASDAEEERVELSFAAGDEGVVAPVAAVAPAAEAEPEAAPPPSLPRPATRFRVLLLKLRKPKGGLAAADAAGTSAAPVASRFLVKLRVDDATPLASLFTRDNSSRASDAVADRPATAAAAAAEPQQQEQEVAASITAEERRFAKEVVLRYLSKIRPLYVKVSRRYGERLRFGGAASEGEEETDAEADPSPSQAPPPSVPAGVVACGVRAPRASVPAGLKQACKRLGKSRSASSAVAVAPSPAAAALSGPQPQRRDDSLLQVQDGIQSAIAHCKRSFNACNGTGTGPPQRCNSSP
ncbi:putative membrane-associated kinase regulator 2 [Zea mays]|uniref:Putative membrane-associated kinase regulator 2 n=1 Tax=Zea mays TaxID=4577 RepID=A0A3L6DM19_MAIZE|nr:putative membrane-associated kinase regulator 2 [Zea mays]